MQKKNRTFWEHMIAQRHKITKQWAVTHIESNERASISAKFRNRVAKLKAIVPTGKSEEGGHAHAFRRQEIELIVVEIYVPQTTLAAKGFGKLSCTEGK